MKIDYENVIKQEAEKGINCTAEDIRRRAKRITEFIKGNGEDELLYFRATFEGHLIERILKVAEEPLFKKRAEGRELVLCGIKDIAVTEISYYKTAHPKILDVYIESFTESGGYKRFPSGDYSLIKGKKFEEIENEIQAEKAKLMKEKSLLEEKIKSLE